MSHPVRRARVAGGGGILLALGAVSLALLGLLAALLLTGRPAGPRIPVDTPAAIGLLALGLGAVLLLAGLAFLTEGVLHVRLARHRAAAEPDPDTADETPAAPSARDEPRSAPVTFADPEDPAFKVPALDVGHLEGVDAAARARLHAAGVRTFRHLLDEDAYAIADRSGLHPAAVKAYQQAARLTVVPNLGPREAALLVEAGVETPVELARQEAQELAARLNALNRERRLLEGDVHIGEVRQWIGQAR